MRKLNLIISFCLIFLISCKKISNNKIDATIYVKEFKSETPIVNAEVQILRGKPNLGYGTELVETIYTDNDGKAIYKTKVDKNYNYYAFAKPDNYYNDDDQVIISRGKRDFNTTIYKYAKAYVKLHLINNSPINQFDLIHLQSSCYSYNFQGQNTDTTILWCDECSCDFWGGYSYNSGCWITKNNITTNLHYSFTPIPFDTITVEINY